VILANVLAGETLQKNDNDPHITRRNIKKKGKSKCSFRFSRIIITIKLISAKNPRIFGNVNILLSISASTGNVAIKTNRTH
jgi:hypothetical protein